MKKILILAYDYPPYISVGGLRPFSWHQYMHEFGIHPVVVTRQWSNQYGNSLDYIAPGTSSETIIEASETGTILKAPYTPTLANKLLLTYGENRFKFIRRLLTGWYELLQYFFSIGPKAPIYRAARDYLKENKVECIIASGDPFILFDYAAKLGRRFQVPWVADYRDPWSQDFPLANKPIRKAWNRFLELKIVSTAKLVVTVSGYFEFQISNLLKDKETIVIPNGYNPDVIERVKSVNQNKNIFTIGFVGTIYDWNPVRSVLSVANNFLNQEKDAKLNLKFYGINLETELNEMIARDFPRLQQSVSIYPKQDNYTTLKELATVNAVLLFNYYVHMGTKIYDYLAINRTILLCYTDDEEAKQLKQEHYWVLDMENTTGKIQEDLIIETEGGIVVKDAEHLYQVLVDLNNEFLKEGSIKCTTKNIEKYSRKHETQKLVEAIMNTVNVS